MIDFFKLYKSALPVGSFVYLLPDTNPNCEFGGEWKLINIYYTKVSERYLNGEPMPYFYDDTHDKKVQVQVCLWQRTA